MALSFFNLKNNKITIYNCSFHHQSIQRTSLVKILQTRWMANRCDKFGELQQRQRSKYAKIGVIDVQNGTATTKQQQKCPTQVLKEAWLSHSQTGELQLLRRNYDEEMAPNVQRGVDGNFKWSLQQGIVIWMQFFST